MTLDSASRMHLADVFFSHDGNLSDKWEHYLAIYEAELGRFQASEQPVALLEVGVQNGGSLQIWSKYLPAGSSIVGIDIDPACANLSLGSEIEVLIGDASSSEELGRLLGERQFDIIVDDGSHRSDHIRSTFIASFQRLKPGGLYVVEDLHCSFLESFGGGLRRAGAAMEFFKSLCDGLNVDHIDTDSIGQLDPAEAGILRAAGEQIARITFYDSVVVVEKSIEQKPVPFRRIMTGSALPVHSPAAAIASTTKAAIGSLILSESMTRSLAPMLLEQLASGREEIGRLREHEAAAQAVGQQARENAERLENQRALMDLERNDMQARLADLEGKYSRAESELNRLRHEHAEDLARLKAEASALEGQQTALRAQHSALLAQHSAVIAQQGALIARHAADVAQRDQLAGRVNAILDSTCWQVTAPARALVTGGKRLGRALVPKTAAHPEKPPSAVTTALREFSSIENLKVATAKVRLARRRLGSWREVGRRAHRYTTSEGLAGLAARFHSYGTPPPPRVLPAIIESRYAEIRADVSRRIAEPPPAPPGSDAVTDGPLISIILPVYRAPIDLVDKAIRSVTAQSYPRWELCIVDDGSDQAPLIEKLQRLAAQDSRIKLHLSEANAGIAAASNQAIAHATGDYLGFLDHDDVLTYDALRCVAQVLADEPDTDIVYTDECKIDDMDQVHEVFCKPDWSPALLLNSMYIGHLSIYRRSLVSRLGGLRSEYNFSQDYDLALRLTDGPVNVRHVDRILYCWRSTKGSAAAGDKPFARQSNIAALQDALNRRGYAAQALALPTANRVRWQPTNLQARVSVIIPSDNPDHITACARSILENTKYPNYEVIVVTRSAIADGLSKLKRGLGVRFAPYDQPYNFSDKCNAGAAIAEGAFLVFVNDDVRVISEDWIQTLLECLQLKGVGAAAPKLLYEDGSIQHAGLVCGVRRLIGTAFHTLPANETSYFNLAQSMREASSISGACLMMPAELFKTINGYDAVNTPVAHSDVDLCFRLKDVGYRSVYTPHATMLHIGHQSLAVYEKEARRDVAPAKRRKDKADIHLLRHWPSLIARDPYYPPRMKALLYADSPEEFDIYPAAPKGAGGLDILILSHDLTNSGAPRIVFDMVRVLTGAGHFVVVMAPADGFYRKLLVEAGATVIIEPLLCKGHETVLDFARNFDRVIANTVVMLPAVLQLSPVVDVYWYIHESQLLMDEFQNKPDFVRALGQAKQVWANSRRSLRFIPTDPCEVSVVEYGVDTPSDFTPDEEEISTADGPAEFIIVGSYEPRKGQDLAIAGIGLLPDDVRARCRFSFYGRVLDPVFYETICSEARNWPQISIGPELTHEECRAAMRRSDVILCPSRDDSFSLVAMEAIGFGKVVVCTADTGVSDYLEHERSGFVMAHCTPECVRDGIMQCLEARADWPQIGRRGRDVLRSLFTPSAFEERIKRQLSA